MYRKIVGILVVMLLITTTVLNVTGIMLDNELLYSADENYKFTVEDLKYIDYAPGEILVKFKDDVTSDKRVSVKKI